ncbi:MAG: competence protein [Tissierellia bacterium]|nr:competence protein [Tissierellia bacterium]
MKKSLGYILVLIVFVIIGLIVNNSEFSLGRSDETEKVEILLDDSENTEDKLFVHVVGAVRYPGLIKLSPGDRVADAIEKCGGLLDEADINMINLAEMVSDEDKIHIPAKGEETYLENGTGKININIASLEELCALPNIGPVTAGNIIEHRKKSKITCREDLLEIAGIGERTVSQIEDLIKY